MSEQSQEPCYLTNAGRRRLEQRLAGYLEQLRRLQSPAEDRGVEDRADAAGDLETADDQAQLQDLIDVLRTLLERVRPLPEEPDDGVIRQGSTVEVRDAQGTQQRLMLVDGAELEDGADTVSTDAPVGRGLLGHRMGETVAVPAPHGERVLTILSVKPYRASAG